MARPPKMGQEADPALAAEQPLGFHVTALPSAMPSLSTQTSLRSGAQSRPPVWRASLMSTADPRDNNFHGLFPKAVDQGGLFCSQSSSFSRGSSTTNESVVQSFESSSSAEPQEAAECCSTLFFERIYEKVSPQCAALNRNPKFQFVMFGALLCVLFCPDFWVLVDRPDNVDLDIILSCALAMFIFEISLQLLGKTSTYVNSFFFWMDSLGAASVLLDISCIANSLIPDDSAFSQNTVVMKGAKVAKLGARVGRFTKLVKLLRFLPGMRNLEGNPGMGRVLSSRLNLAISVRVSCLIIVLVMILPLFRMFTFPEQDWSMKSFMDLLDQTSVQHPHSFAWQLAEFVAFYEDKPYYPYYLDLRSKNEIPSLVLQQLPWRSSRGPPSRASNSLKYVTSNLVCEFNFDRPNQTDALLSMVMLVLVILLMVGFVGILSLTVSALVLVPLEKLLTQVRKMASTIFDAVANMRAGKAEAQSLDGEESFEDNGQVDGEESKLLVQVVRKLETIGDVKMARTDSTFIDKIQALNEFDKALIHGFQGTVRSGTQLLRKPRIEELTSFANEEDGMQAEEPGGESAAKSQVAQDAMVESVGLPLLLIDSWNFNPLELDKPRNHAAVLYCVGLQNHGVNFDTAAMTGFLANAEARYLKSCPYHNWFHAIDVTHGVYRLLKICAADTYMSDLECYGLLVSAVGHDIGHPGLNNSFLIQSGYELALIYSDKSPLENMHCAKLFELFSMPNCNIFATLPRSELQDIRAVCINAILNTDNAQHFNVIRQVEILYEINSEIFDMYFRGSPEAITFPEFTVDIYRQTDVRRLFVRLFLRMADLSGPMKPFHISRIWAWQVLEEFFAQGDRERDLGMPVQALNDREHVNREFSQIGMIEFLVSPLLLTVVKVLPPIEPQFGQMLQNMATWERQWLDSTPQLSEAEKKAVSDRVARLEIKFNSI